MELILPGGSVMALLLWLYRRRKNGVRAVAHEIIGVPQIGKSVPFQCRSECIRVNNCALLLDRSGNRTRQA